MALISITERYYVSKMKSDEIKISDITIYNGRNIFSHRQAIKMIVDIGKYGNIPTNMISGFNERLLELFPGLKTNCCSLGYEGGFLERLSEGTYLAHVLEHTILEMQYMLGYPVSYGKTRTLVAPSVYYLVYEFANEVCGLECGKAAVFIFNYLLSGKSLQLDEFLKYLGRISSESELGPSTSAIVEQAKKRGIPVTRIGSESMVRLGYGRYSRLVESTLTDATSCISADISCNKQLTKQILKEHQIPVPYGKVVYSEISALMAAAQIGMPVVIKPFDSNQGKGVHLNLNSEEEIKAAFRDASKYSSGIIVERFVSGRDFRILVVGGKVRAVSERIPACVAGDGMHTIKELIELENNNPSRGEKHEKPLTRLKLDQIAVDQLNKSGYSPESIPPEGSVVKLRENGNLSTGGTAIDRTDVIHPENAELAEMAAEAIGIDIAGIDVVAEDISKPIFETGGAVVEVNTAPGIRMHLYPSVGKPRNVAKDIVDLLFPDERSTKFPLVSVTGTNGKTTVVRLIAHSLEKAGIVTGMTTTEGTYIGQKCICRGDNSGPRSARSLLSNKTIDAAVLETARGGIIREGLGYDLADVGIITNITEDHLGLDGVGTIEELAFVKSLVAEAVKEEGCAVLNAEDAATRDIIKRVKSRVMLFYTDLRIGDLYKGYPSAFVKNGTLCIRDGKSEIVIAPVSDIPITGGGLIDCNIENCLAAAAALYSLKIPVRKIKEGLLSFKENSGRFELYELQGIKIMLDYGHNPAGYAQAIKVCERMGCKRIAGVIGLPGDRSISAERAIAELSADAFDRIYVKEDSDTRGRKKGEVASDLYDFIIKKGFPAATIVENEAEAMKKAISEAVDGDLIVVFYEKLRPLHEYLIFEGAKKLPATFGAEHKVPCVI